jgi:peptide/nickel transport system permease protein
MTKMPEALEIAENEFAAKKKSQLKEVWKRFKRNRMAMIGLVVLIVLIVIAIFAPVLAPYPYAKQHLIDKLAKPGAKYLLGADHFGRDILSRLFFGARISLVVGFISVGVGLSIGGLLGALAAFYGGRVDNIIMRLNDVMQAVPQTILAIAISAALGSGIIYTMLAVGISTIPVFSRITRASMLMVKEQEYIEAATAIGANHRRIILRHILPNSLAPILVQATSNVAAAILTAASLSFIGLGVQPPTPEWGAMLAEARSFVRQYPTQMLFPGIFIMISVLSFNLLGDALRDALDPKLNS